MSEPQFGTGKHEVRPCDHCGSLVEHSQMLGMYWGHEYWLPTDLRNGVVHRAPCGVLCDSIPSHEACCGVVPLKHLTEDEQDAVARKRWDRGENTFTPYTEQKKP